jgi:hypothetical protein
MSGVKQTLEIKKDTLLKPVEERDRDEQTGIRSPGIGTSGFRTSGFRIPD